MTFVKLKEKATPGPLSQLCDYIQSTWIDGYCGTPCLNCVTTSSLRGLTATLEHNVIRLIHLQSSNQDQQRCQRLAQTTKLQGRPTISPVLRPATAAPQGLVWSEGGGGGLCPVGIFRARPYNWITYSVQWWWLLDEMKLGGNRPLGDNPLLLSISGMGSFICPVA